MKIPLFLLIGAFSSASCSSDSTSDSVKPIGVYDSRALAIAYAGSPHHEQKLQGLMKKHQAAKEAGDSKTVAELEAQGQAIQKKAHQQAFGTDPVEDILATIPDEVSALKEKSGVSHLVSKWDQKSLRKHPLAQRVNLTLPLIDALSPKPEQKKRALSILKTNP